MELTAEGNDALDKILGFAKDTHIDIKGGKIRRTSSRFCLGAIVIAITVTLYIIFW